MSAQTVSVIIPAYNAAKTVSRSIASALEQTYLPLEVIVVDDGSSDNTPEVVASFKAAVRFEQKTNGGPASARNRGGRIARGDWLAFLDADDWWAPTKLERQLSLDVSPEIGLIHTLANISKPNVPAVPSFDDLWQNNWIVNSSTLIRRSVFESLDGFNEDPRLISVEDYHLWLRVAAAGWRIVTCPEVLTYYTRGIGLSSNIPLLARASLYNVDLIGRELGLPAEKLQAKRLALYEEFGKAALFERNLPLARLLLKKSVLARPSITLATHFLAASMPAGLLNARRQIFSRASESGEEAAGQSEPRPFWRDEHARMAQLPSVPTLLVLVETGQDFTWQIAAATRNSVMSTQFQHRAMRILERFGIVPTFAVSYLVASQEDSYAPLREYFADGKCGIGAELLPWITPPIREQVSERNSFAGNLSAVLEYEKISVLTSTIEESFGSRPSLYCAGRHGLGPNTAVALVKLGYTIDCSVLPFHDLRSKLGPDFRNSPTDAFWVGTENALLEIPVTVGTTGALWDNRKAIDRLSSPRAETLYLPELCAGLHLLKRSRLTPESTSLAGAKQLTRHLRAAGRSLFVLSFHSLSLAPGQAPYVRTTRDLERLLHWIEEYLEFFFDEIGGKAITPTVVFQQAVQAATGDHATNHRPAVTEVLK